MHTRDGLRLAGEKYGARALGSAGALEIVEDVVQSRDPRLVGHLRHLPT
jgi:hypothetical protein